MSLTNLAKYLIAKDLVKLIKFNHSECDSKICLKLLKLSKPQNEPKKIQKSSAIKMLRA